MISTHLHDAIFAVGAAVLLLAMLPAVWRRAVMPLSTCVVTGTVVFVLVLNYATMAYWYATAMEAGNCACWAYLLSVAMRARALRRPSAAATAPVARHHLRRGHRA